MEAELLHPHAAAAPMAEPRATDMVVRGLVKSFDGRTPVLRDISFEVPQGQSVALIGANGCGKSTLLRCCLRLIVPDAGEVRLLGRDMTRLGSRGLRQTRAQVGFVFQRHNLVPRLSVLSNVLHGAQSRNWGPHVWYQSFAPRQFREQALDCLARVGLAELASRRVDELSGGQSQRVAIARALMQRPRIIFADEPVASLDPAAGEEVMALFTDLLRDEGLTLLFVSHNLDHAVSYADRLLGLRRGRLALDQPARNAHIGSLRELYA